jgi:hypothetical protein
MLVDAHQPAGEADVHHANACKLEGIAKRPLAFARELLAPDGCRRQARDAIKASARGVEPLKTRTAAWRSISAFAMACMAGRGKNVREFRAR